MRIFLFLVGILGIASRASACSVCFKGAANDPNMIGVRMAILFMLGILVFIGAALIKFCIGISKRSKLLNQ